MRFLMLVCTDPEPDTASGEGEMAVDDWVAKHDAAGTRLMGERIRPPADTRVVRKRGGKVTVTEGPYAESGEWIAGFDVIDVADEAEAVAVAAEHEMARHGRIELRPFWGDAD